LEDNHIRRSLTPEFEAMADKTLHEFLALTTANIRTGPKTNVGDNGFEVKPALINMVQANEFYEKCRWNLVSSLPRGMPKVVIYR
jgi:hypothetical protein